MDEEKVINLGWLMSVSIHAIADVIDAWDFAIKNTDNNTVLFRTLSEALLRELKFHSDKGINYSEHFKEQRRLYQEEKRNVMDCKLKQ